MRDLATSRIVAAVIIILLNFVLPKLLATFCLCWSRHVGDDLSFDQSGLMTTQRKERVMKTSRGAVSWTFILVFLFAVAAISVFAFWIVSLAA